MDTELKTVKDWKQIPGWFDDQGVFSDLLAQGQLPRVPLCVEVGTWLGRSAAAFLNAALSPEIAGAFDESRFCLYCVDTWEGSPDEEVYVSLRRQLVESEGTSALEKFKAVCQQYYPMFRHVHGIQRTSIVASTFFKDRSIDYLFLDGAHTHEDVLTDLSNWYPKMKKQAVLLGHDFGWGEVNLALRQFAESRGLAYRPVGNECWLLDVL